MKKLIRYGLEVGLVMVIIRYWFILNKLNYQYLHTFAEGSGNNIILSSPLDISGYLLAVGGAITLIILLSAWNGWTIIELYQSAKVSDAVLVVFNFLICSLVIIAIQVPLLKVFGVCIIIALLIADVLLASQYISMNGLEKSKESTEIPKPIKRDSNPKIKRRFILNLAILMAIIGMLAIVLAGFNLALSYKYWSSGLNNVLYLIAGITFFISGVLAVNDELQNDKNNKEKKLTYTQTERTEIKKNAKKVAGLLGENFSDIEKEAQDMQTDHFKAYADDGQKRLVDALQKNNFSLAQLKSSKEETRPEPLITEGTNKEENNNASH
jgi:hypothetical protein